MYRGSKYCSARRLSTQRREGKASRWNSQKARNAGVKELKRGIGVVDLSDIWSICKAKSEAVEEVSKEVRVLLTRGPTESSRVVEMLCR